MRYTHRDMSRTFQVPFGSWIVPIVGSLLCILLMQGISKATGFRFLVWIAIGQIVYFSYGFWHSKRRQPRQEKPVNSSLDPLPTVECIAMTYKDNASELDSGSEITDIYL
jgi:amino acid transporter